MYLAKDTLFTMFIDVSRVGSRSNDPTSKATTTNNGTPVTSSSPVQSSNGYKLLSKTWFLGIGEQWEFSFPCLTFGLVTITVSVNKRI